MSAPADPEVLSRVLSRTEIVIQEAMEALAKIGHEPIGRPTVTAAFQDASKTALMAVHSLCLARRKLEGVYRELAKSHA